MSLLETRGPHVFGPWTLTQIVEWEGESFPHDDLFPNISIESIREASPSGASSRLAENGMITMSTQLFLLRRDDLVVLIELGTGNGKKRPTESYWDNQNLPYMETLAALTVQPEDVAYVFMSHAHVDHVGLATTRKDDHWTLTFPNAKYILYPAEWNYWSKIQPDDPRWHPCLDDSVKPLMDAGCVQWVQENESVAGIRVHAAPGHTPGNVIFEVEGQNLWFLGDLLHHPAQVAHPEWPSASFDADPELNTHTRRHYLKCFADSGAALFAVHMGNAFRITETASGRLLARYD